MEPMHHLVFGPFRIDPQARRLWRGDAPVPLQARPLAVLCYLSAHPDRVVTAEELLHQVWQGTYVTKTAVKVCIRAIRGALGEEAEHPIYLETVGREGYRFRPAAGAGPRPPHGPGPMPMVGRERALQHLERGLASALRGARQVVFVTGEPGIGKTTLVDHFLAQVAASGQVSIGRGQCLEQYGEGEAYLPVLEAIGHWCQGPGGQQVLHALQHCAPTWLVQMPALLAEPERERLQRQAAGATRERMVREMAEALEALTADRALVLVLEDVQWSDRSTVDLLAYLARRRAAARLLVLGTYRPTDLVLRAHPLHGIKQELQAHGQCAEVRLEVLTSAEVQTYVTQRLGQQPPPAGLAGQVYQRTDGNPLFMVHVVEQYLQQGRLEEHVPESVQELIGRQVARLRAAEQRVLEVGSVAGMEFAVATVAAALQDDADVIEGLCEALAQTSPFLQEAGLAEWPDGTLSGCYRFRHTLYQQVLYAQMAAARRVRLHRVIGAYEERIHGPQAVEIAAELAMHFERGRDAPRAVHYLQRAGENAARRSAHREAIDLLTKGLEMLTHLPDTPARAHHELAMLTTIGPVLVATQGYAADDVEHTYRRAQQLCQAMGDSPQLFQVLHGMWLFYFVRGVLQTAHALGEQLFSLAQRLQDPALLLAAHRALGQTLAYLGELTPAQAHLEQGIALYDPQQHHGHAFRFGAADPGVGSWSYAAWVAWLCGYPQRALTLSQKAVTLAQELVHPFSLTVALFFAALPLQCRREGQATHEQAEVLITLASAQGFSLYVAWGMILQGWALSTRGHYDEALARMHQGLTAARATGAELLRPYFLALLAEVYGSRGQPEAGLTVVTEALGLVEKNHEVWWGAEIHRLQGALLLQYATPDLHQVETCFQQALTIARHQQAKSLELRAAMSLSRLWQQQGKRPEAHALLAPLYAWFIEGFDTADLQDAKVLLWSLA
jgi:predicted ATPase